MRNIILGSVAGLLIGSVGALAYSHFAGDGSALTDLQSQLADANTKLAKTQANMKFLREQYNSETDQLNHVLASKQDQPASTDGTPVAAAPASNPLTVGGVAITPDMVRGFLAMAGRAGPGGGFRSPEQRTFLMQARLKLDPDQAKAIKAAMDADEQVRRDAFRQARQNRQPVDPQALAAANNLDKTLSTVLSPSQQLQYQQLQADEKQARAETQATQQVDNMMPLLQLNDDQKGKLMNALYQQQLATQDNPGGLAANPNPLAALAQQGQAVSAAMKSVLNPDQYALYQQNEQVQAQAMQNFGGQGGNGRRTNRTDAGGQGQTAGGGAAGAAPAASASTSTATTSSSGTSTTATGTTITGTTTDSSSSTNTPSATTNAAPATPPAGT
jgi:hypothetical protein